MIGPKQIVGELAVIYALKGRVAVAEQDVREAVLDALDAGDGLTAHLPNGDGAGRITVVHGACTAGVSDVDAFTKWVAEQHPTEIETVTVVRPSFRSQVLRHAQAKGAPVTRDGEHVPGVIVTRAAPHVQVKQTPEQAAAVADAWLRREITAPSLTASIEAPTTSTGETP